MKSEVLRDWGAVDGLRAEWEDLLCRSRADSLFLTPQWVRCWLDTGGRAFEAAVVTVRDGARLVGLAPFYRTEMRLLAWLPYHTLRMTGDYASGAVYPDFIVDRDCEAEASGAIAAALQAHPSLFDCVWLPKVAGWTGAADRIAASCRAAGFQVRRRPFTFSAFDLPDSMEKYVCAMSRPKRYQLRKELRTILGPGTEVRRCTDPREVESFLDALFDLHQRRRSRLGDEGVFRRKPAEAAFYRCFAPVALARGWLRLFGLFVHGEAKAVQIGYAYNGVLHTLQEGFDPDYLKGSGNALRAKVFESAIAEGFRGVDLLGGLTEHKRRWLGVARAGSDLFIGRRSLKNWLLFSWPVWPTGRLLRHPPYPRPPSTLAPAPPTRSQVPGW